MALHCPVCGLVLTTYALPDSKRVGYLCQCGHSFFTWSRPFARYLPKPEKTPALPQGATDLAILRYWLTDRVAREQLVDHLSLVCERLIEILDGTTAPALGTGEKSHEATERDERRADARQTVNRLANEGRVHQLLVNFCLVCGRPLSKHDEPRELYLDGFVCSAGHLVWYRGSILYFTQDDVSVELWFLCSDAWLGRTLDDALGRTNEQTKQIWEPLVHPQLRAALSRLRHYLP